MTSRSLSIFWVHYVMAAHVYASMAAFDFPNAIPTFFKPSQSVSFLEKKEKLVEAVSNTNNGRTATRETQARVLAIVGDLEMSDPPSDDLLTNPDLARILDGVWYLQYTSPSNIGDNVYDPDFASEDGMIETKQFDAQGSVVAAGITVDASNRSVKQIFNVTENTVSNVITFDWGTLTVAGNFRPSSRVPRRAVVSFQKLSIEFSNGITLKLDFVFHIADALRKTVGGWIETTYLAEDMRIARGNKGSMFILTRDPDFVKP